MTAEKQVNNLNVHNERNTIMNKIEELICELRNEINTEVLRAEGRGNETARNTISAIRVGVPKEKVMKIFNISEEDYDYYAEVLQD